VGSTLAVARSRESLVAVRAILFPTDARSLDAETLDRRGEEEEH